MEPINNETEVKDVDTGSHEDVTNPTVIENLSTTPLWVKITRVFYILFLSLFCFFSVTIHPILVLFFILRTAGSDDDYYFFWGSIVLFTLLVMLVAVIVSFLKTINSLGKKIIKLPLFLMALLFLISLFNNLYNLYNYKKEYNKEAPHRLHVSQYNQEVLATFPKIQSELSGFEPIKCGITSPNENINTCSYFFFNFDYKIQDDKSLPNYNLEEQALSVEDISRIETYLTETVNIRNKYFNKEEYPISFKIVTRGLGVKTVISRGVECSERYPAESNTIKCFGDMKGFPDSITIK